VDSLQAAGKFVTLTKLAAGHFGNAYLDGALRLALRHAGAPNQPACNNGHSGQGY
jgi:hypothetical protein